MLQQSGCSMPITRSQSRVFFHERTKWQKKPLEQGNRTKRHGLFVLFLFLYLTYSDGQRKPDGIRWQKILMPAVHPTPQASYSLFASELEFSRGNKFLWCRHVLIVQETLFEEISLFFRRLFILPRQKSFLVVVTFGKNVSV